jgi:gas vesicle protein
VSRHAATQLKRPSAQVAIRFPGADAAGRDSSDRRYEMPGRGGLRPCRQVMDQARARLGIQRKEERRWRSFFVGLVIGAIAGAIAALLTAPRAGREMRDELAARAREAATTAREAATTAREAAGSATDWVPLFQRSPDETLDASIAETGRELPANDSESLVDVTVPVEDIGHEGAPPESAPSVEDEVE